MNRLFNWSWMRKLWKKWDNDKEEGPINRLPNELIQVILDKLELDGDVKKLIRLRLVSTRWRAEVEDYCRMKKSLIVDMNQKSGNNFSYIEKVFFGFANLKDFSILYLSTTKKSSKYLLSLLYLFPNIVQLSIRCHDHTQVDHLITYINSLASLTQLDLDSPFVLSLPNFSPLTKLSPTLFKLKHFSFKILHLFDDEHRQLISNFGPSCVRVYFGVPFDYRQIRQWHDINPDWLANVTHLRISTRFWESEKIVHFLSEHTTLLKHLSIYPLGTPLALNPTVIHDLSKLANLVELELCNFGLDFLELEKAVSQHRLTSISSVSTCKLYFPVDRPFDADQFTRLLSVIFPNLINLYLYIGEKLKKSKFFELYQPFLDEVEQYLYRFQNLRKHEIKV